MLRLAFLSVLLVSTAAQAQVEYRVEGPGTSALGYPIVLNVFATRADLGAYPAFWLRGMTDGEAVTVHRDSARGPVVEWQPTLIVCGTQAPFVQMGRAWPAGTQTHRRLVIHDARISEPGRYVLRIPVGDLESEGDTLSHPVHIVEPMHGPEAARTVARALRQSTDLRYASLDTNPLDLWLEAEASTREYPVGNVAVALAAITAAEHATNLRLSASHNLNGADSLALSRLALAERLAARIHPTEALAPRLHQALSSARSPPESPPWITGTCGGTQFSVVGAEGAQAEALPSRERVAVSPGRWATVAFQEVPVVVQLIREGQVLGVARPNFSTCRDDLGVSPPPE